MSFRQSIVFIFVGIMLILLISNASAKDEVKLDELYIEAEKAVLSNRSYYLLPGEQKRHELSFGMRFNYNDKFYNKLKVRSITGTSQFRFIGLDNELGMNYKVFQIYFRHFSGHALDTQYNRRFPEDNSIGVRIHLLR